MTSTRSAIRQVSGVALLAAVAVLALGSSALAQTSPSTTSPPPPNEGTKPVDLVVERRLDYPYDLPSPNYVPLRVRLFEPGTQEPAPELYEVLASVREDRPGARAETFGFSYPYAEDPAGESPGVYLGTVIVPNGGRFRIAANAFNVKDVAQTGEIPTPLGTGQLVIDIEAPTLGGISQELRQVEADVAELLVLILHSFFAFSWFALAGVVVMLATPFGRRTLSGAWIERLDRNMGRLSQGLLWATVGVWATGIIQLQIALPFTLPLTPGEISDTFRLPYASAYFVALFTKMGLFLGMTILAVPLVRAARHRATQVDMARILESRRVAVGGAGGPAVGVGGSALAVEASASAQAMEPTSLLTRVSMAWMGIGGAVVIVCVAILKFNHILTEQVR